MFCLSLRRGRIHAPCLVANRRVANTIRGGSPSLQKRSAEGWGVDWGAALVRRIRAKGRGWVFTPKDFLDVGIRATVDQTLSRLARKGAVRRLDRGLYDYPKQHDKLGTLSPSAGGSGAGYGHKNG